MNGESDGGIVCVGLLRQQVRMGVATAVEDVVAMRLYPLQGREAGDDTLADLFASDLWVV